MKYEGTIQQYADQREKELQELIRVHREETDANLTAIKAFGENLPAFNGCLAHFHIKPIEEIKTFHLSAENKTATTHLTCDVDDKFRFITFKGYDARGRGKNHNQLVAKAERIEKYFLEKGFKIGINFSSLEENTRRAEWKKVLIDWQI